MRVFLKIAIISLVIHINSFKVNACSYYIPPPIEFDSSGVMFKGIVIDYVGPYNSSKIKNPLYGLIVELNDKEYFPNGSGKYEFFPLAIASDCSPISYDLEYLKLYYPIGSQLRIIGKTFSTLDENMRFDEIGKIRIISWKFLGAHSVSVVYDHPLFLEQEIFHRQKFSKTAQKISEELSENSYPTKSLFLWSSDKLEEWYLVKELFELEKTDSEEDKAKIISRLAYFWFDENRFKQLLKRHIKSWTIRIKLLGKYKKIRNT